MCFDYAKMSEINSNQKILPSNVGYQIIILKKKMIMIVLMWKMKRMMAVM